MPMTTLSKAGRPEMLGKGARADGCRSRLVLAGRVAVIVLVVALSIFLFIHRDRVAEYGTLGYAGIFLISLAGNLSILVPMPAPLAAFAGGSLFNPLAAGLVAASGAALGEMSSYAVGLSGMPLVKDRQIYARVKGFMERYGYSAIFILAIIPAPLFDVAGLVAGALRMNVPRFFLVTLAGKSIKFVVIASLGAGLANVVA
jgi:membrane protein DedA with SNARE-associated domain